VLVWLVVRCSPPYRVRTRFRSLVCTLSLVKRGLKKLGSKYKWRNYECAVAEPINVSVRSLRWRIKFFMGLHCVTWVHSFVCLIYRVGIVAALPAIIIWSCHPLNYPLLAVEL